MCSPALPLSFQNEKCVVVVASLAVRIGPFLGQRCLPGEKLPQERGRLHEMAPPLRQPPRDVVLQGIPWARRVALDLVFSVCRQAVQRFTFTERPVAGA